MSTQAASAEVFEPVPYAVTVPLPADRAFALFTEGYNTDLAVPHPLAQSSSAVTVPAPTVRPPSRIAKVWPTSSATGLPSATVTCTVSPGAASAAAPPVPLMPPRSSTPDTPVVRR